MAPILPITLSYSVRRRLAYALQFMHLSSCLFGVSMFIFGTYMLSFMSKLAAALGGSYNYGFLYFSVFVAVSSTFVHIIGLRVCHYIADWTVLYKHNLMTPLLFIIYLIPLTANIALLAVFASLCNTHSNEIKKAYESGMKISMEKYKDNKEVKRVIDETQTHYQCCGAEDFQDWFYTSWINTKFVNFQSRRVIANVKSDGLYKPVSVPFSCCKLLSRRPCISTDINDKTKHYKYQPDVDMTVNFVGCGKAVGSYVGSAILWHFRQAGIVFAVVESVMLIVYRYVTTSSVVAVNGGNPLFSAPGYFLHFGDDIKPIFPKTQAEYADKMEQLQEMADKRLDDKFRQDRGPPSEESDDDDDDNDNDNDNANKNSHIKPSNVNVNASDHRRRGRRCGTSRLHSSNQKTSTAAIELHRLRDRQLHAISTPKRAQNPSLVAISNAPLPTEKQLAQVRTAQWLQAEPSRLVKDPAAANKTENAVVRRDQTEVAADAIQSTAVGLSQSTVIPLVNQPSAASVARQLATPTSHVTPQLNSPSVRAVVSHQAVSSPATQGQSVQILQRLGHPQLSAASSGFIRKTTNVLKPEQVSWNQPPRGDDRRVQRLEECRPLLKDAKKEKAKSAVSSPQKRPQGKAVKLSVPRRKNDNVQSTAQHKKSPSARPVSGTDRSKIQNTPRSTESPGRRRSSVSSARGRSGPSTHKSISRQAELKASSASRKSPQTRVDDRTSRKLSNTLHRREATSTTKTIRKRIDAEQHRKKRVGTVNAVDVRMRATEVRSKSLERPLQPKQHVPTGTTAISMSVPPPDLHARSDSVERKPPLPKCFRPFSAVRLRTGSSRQFLDKSTEVTIRQPNVTSGRQQTVVDIHGSSQRDFGRASSSDRVQRRPGDDVTTQRRARDTVVDLGHLDNVSTHNAANAAVVTTRLNYPTSTIVDGSRQHLGQVSSSTNHINFTTQVPSTVPQVICQPVARTINVASTHRQGQQVHRVAAAERPQQVTVTRLDSGRHSETAVMADIRMTPSSTTIRNDSKKIEGSAKQTQIKEASLVDKTHRSDERSTARSSCVDDTGDSSLDTVTGSNCSDSEDTDSDDSDSKEVSWVVSSDVSSGSDVSEDDSEESPSMSESEDEGSDDSSGSDE